MSQGIASPKNGDFARNREVQEQIRGENFTFARFGPVEELAQYAVTHPLTGREIPAKLFLHAPLELTGMEISLGMLPPGISIPFYHKHKQNEEVYLFLSGSGQFSIDGEIVPLSPGSAVRVAPEGVRCCRNTSSEMMFYIVIQAKAGSLEQWTATDGVGVPDPVTWPE